MEEKKYTPEEIIDITINNLSNISVPAALTEQISIPIIQNIGNLRKALEIMTKPAEEEPIELGEIDLEEDGEGKDA